MKDALRKLKEDRFKLWEDMKTLNDLTETENRAMTTEETDSWAKMEGDIAGFDERIERSEKLITAEERMGDRDADDLGDLDDDPGENRSSEDELRTAAFGKFLQRGAASLTGDEVRALQADSDTIGGYLVTPVQFVKTLIKAVDNLVFMRQFATVYTVNKAESLGAPSLDNDPADPAWTAEIATGDEDSTMSFGRRELSPHPLAKLLKVSGKLLRVSAMSVESLVRDRLAYKFATTMENTFMNGTGASQPLGIFVASANGISTGRDVATGNTTTSIKTDGLIEALFSLKSQYHKSARWIFHRDAIKQIRKLKDGEGQYIWAPGISAEVGNNILGRPYHMSEYAPSTFTTGQYVGLVGDMSKYWIADALSMQIQRLNELYAATNQVGFLGRLESDGMPVMEEAFARVTLA